MQDTTQNYAAPQAEMKSGMSFTEVYTSDEKGGIIK